MVNHPEGPFGTWVQDLAIGPGATILVMADLTRSAWVARRSGRRFDARALLDAIIDRVGPAGNVLIPTFTYDLKDGDSFDIRRSRSISGALANAALEHPAFRRTKHPLHSFAVAGAHADALAAIDHAGSFDDRSPFAFLLEQRARLIAVDLDLDDAFTFVHFVEQRVGVPYRKFKELTIRYTDRDGVTSPRRFVSYAKRTGHVNRFDALQAPLLEAGAMSVRAVHGSRILDIDLARAYDLIAADIRDNKARSIHHFSPVRWFIDTMKSVLRRFGVHSLKDRVGHAASPR